MHFLIYKKLSFAGETPDNRFIPRKLLDTTKDFLLVLITDFSGYMKPLGSCDTKDL